MTSLAPPSERIDLRTSAEIKSLIVRAAASSGVSLSAFLIAAAQERAKQILAESETLTLTPRDWNAFFSALDKVDKPRPALKAAATGYLAWRKKTIHPVTAFDGRIEALAALHERRNFSCGEPALDDYLRRFARQHAVSNLSRTYVAAKGPRISGYYTLAMSAIRKEHLPQAHHKRFPNFPVPVARLARLAVDQGQQGQGLGQLLLMDALYRCHRLSGEIGSAGVVVDAKHLRAQRYYQRFNFEVFPETPLTLWLPAAALAKLFGK